MKFLGIDCGTQGTKAVILDVERGVVLGEGSAPHPLTEAANGRREQNPADWIRALVAATRAALAQAGSDGQDILGVGVSGQQHGLVLLDDSGKVLRPAKLWCDTESTPENQRLLEHLGGVEGSIERLGLAIAPGYTVSKLLWTKEQHPEVFDQIAQVLLPHDYLNFWLTGRAVAEYGDASGTGYFNVRTRQYDLELLRHIDPSGRLERALPVLSEMRQLCSGHATAPPWTIPCDSRPCLCGQRSSSAKTLSSPVRNTAMSSPPATCTVRLPRSGISSTQPISSHSPLMPRPPSKALPVSG